MSPSLIRNSAGSVWRVIFALRSLQSSRVASASRLRSLLGRPKNPLPALRCRNFGSGSHAVIAEMPDGSSDRQSDAAHSRKPGLCAGLTEPAAFEFSVSTLASIQILMRVLNFFAQQDVTPCRVSAEAGKGALNIHLRVEGMSQGGAQLIAERMRSIPHVFSVDLAVSDSSDSGVLSND